MKSRKFSLILMHDDGKAHRFRVGKFFFVVLLFLLLSLPVFGGLGVWVGWNAWQFQQKWQAEQHALELSYADCRLQAERLSNIVRLAGLSTETTGAIPAAPTSASMPSDTASTLASSSPVTAPYPPPAVQPLPSTPEPAVDARLDEAANLDAGVVRLENLLAREQDGRKLRISLDLYNAKPNAGQISGKITFALIDPDGQQHPLDYEDTAFRITRFKKVLVPATLPPALTGADNSALIVTVAADDGTVFLRKIFPVERSRG